MPNKQKLCPEEKAKLVRRFLAGEIGVNEAGRLAGVNSETVREWIHQYEILGFDGLLPYRRTQVYSAELKERAVVDYLTGKDSMLEICKKYSIRSKRLLQQWIKVYNAHGDFNSFKFSGGGIAFSKLMSRQGKPRQTLEDEHFEMHTVLKVDHTRFKIAQLAPSLTNPHSSIYNKIRL